MQLIQKDTPAIKKTSTKSLWKDSSGRCDWNGVTTLLKSSWKLNWIFPSSHIRRGASDLCSALKVFGFASPGYWTVFSVKKHTLVLSGTLKSHFGNHGKESWRIPQVSSDGNQPRGTFIETEQKVDSKIRKRRDAWNSAVFLTHPPPETQKSTKNKTQSNLHKTLMKTENLKLRRLESPQWKTH